MFTTRRFYIDQFLFKYDYLFKGTIIDIGGIKVKPRGNYKFSETLKNSIKFLNNNPITKPDYLFSIEQKLDLKKKFDVIIMNEVIEYIDNIDKALGNVSDLSKKDTFLIITWPWMNTFHGDKEYDFKRYSKVYIEKKLIEIGFNSLYVENNGGFFSVIWDFLHRINQENDNLIKRKLINLFLILTFDLAINLDKLINTSNKVTTGFTLISQKIK